MEDPSLTLWSIHNIYFHLSETETRQKAKEAINRLSRRCLEELEGASLTLQRVWEIYNNSFAGSEVQQKAKEVINRLLLDELEGTLTLQRAKEIYYGSFYGSEAQKRAIIKIAEFFKKE